MTVKEFFKHLDSYGGQIPLTDICDALCDLDISTIPIAKWARFDNQSYQRISVHLGRSYEAMLLCWRPGQKSMIHDHYGSNCGVKVIQGEMSETSFLNVLPDIAVPGRRDVWMPCEVIGSASSDIHEISNEAEEELITLHIYSPPLHAMNIYYRSLDEAMFSFDPMI